MTVRHRLLRVVVLAGFAVLLRPEMTPATVHASPPGLVFHTVNPCRVIDTRTAGGPLVAGGDDRTFTIVGPTCGIPATARAVSLNLAVTQPTASGNVRLYPADAAVPTVSAINYSAGQTRSNNAVVGLSLAGALKARVQPAGSTHLILDVNGYFVAGPSFLGCDSPAEGALVDVVSGTPVPITGTAVGLSDVRVNGVEVVVAGDDTFSTSVTGRYGLNFVELSALDGAGATRTALCAFLGAEHWVTEGVQFDDALLFRIDQGWPKIIGAYPTWFSGAGLQALDSSIAGIGHAIIGNCSGLTATCADIQYLSHSASLVPVAGVNVAITGPQTLNIQVRYNLSLHLRASGKDFGSPVGPITGDAVFNNVVVDASVNLGVDVVSGLPEVGGGTVNAIDLSGANWSQFNGLGPTVRGMVVSFVEDQLALSLGSVVFSGSAGLFEGLFAGMDVTLTEAPFPVGRLDGTANVMVALARRHYLALRNNGMTLGTGLRVTDPPPPVPTGRFPLRLPGNPDVPAVSSDAWSAVHVGVFNQVLQALWRAGLFNGTVDGAALGPGLPAGTSVSVQLATMPVVTGFNPGGAGALDVGALHLVVTHPDLPPGLPVAVGARIGAQAALTADDLVFDGIVADELRISTGAVTLDAAARATLEDLVRRLLLKIAGIALNDSLPVLPEAVFTFPPSLAPYGFPVGGELVGPPSLAIGTHRVVLKGQIGF